MNLYTVKDSESETFIPPFCMQTDRDAVDGFKTVCQDPNTQYHKFPKDFSLYHIGEFDARTGNLKLKNQTLLITAEAILQ